MPLPTVTGWLIDFHTAELIFKSQSNQRIDHCVQQCSAGLLKICHHEEKLFKANPLLRQPFLADQSCVCFPDKAIMQQCANISANPICKKLLAGNASALPLTAIASSRNYGVISDHRSIIFSTVFDLCDCYGIPIMSADEYFAAIP
jgi:hypothetical protein